MVQREEPSPFKRRRRLMSSFFEWRDKRRLLAEERQFRAAHNSPAGKLVGRVIGLLMFVGEYFGSIISGVGNAVQQAIGRHIVRPLTQWQLAAEERQARNQKKGLLSKAITALHYRVWRLSERLNKHSERIRRWTAPFRLVARLPARLAAMLGGGYEALEKRLAESKYLSWLYYLLYGTRVLAESAYEFTQAWFWTRNFRSLIGGIPALTMCIPLLFCLVKIPFSSRTALARHYQQAATEAWREEDFDEVRLCYNKIAQLGVFADTVQFEQARILEQEGDVQGAYDQMKQMATQQESLPAKLWIAAMLLSKKANQLERADDLNVAKQYIDDVLQFDPTNVSASFLLAQYHVRKGTHDQALAVLSRMSETNPSAATMIAEIQRLRGDYAAAKRALEKSLSFYVNEDSLLTWHDHLHLARAKMVAGDFAGMIRTMKSVPDDALSEPGDIAEFRLALTELYVLVFDQIRQQRLGAQLQFDMMEHGISVDPTNREFLERIALLADVPNLNPQVLQVLNDVADEANLPITVHYLLGVSAFHRGDYAEARRRLTRYVEQSPNDPVATNNLAWLMINCEPSDPAGALEFANRAVALAPERADFRETRGQIYLLLKQWTEAITDLEFALNGLPNQLEIHTSLAAAYRQVGELGLAKQHESKVQEAQIATRASNSES